MTSTATPLPRDEQLHLHRSLQEAMSMVRCPYYRSEAPCDGGCHEEPICQTGQPTEGWEARIASLRAQLHGERVEQGASA